MDMGMRILMGLVGIYSAIRLHDGLQSGVISGEFVDFEYEGQPLRYSLCALGHGFSVVASLGMAAGYGPADAWQVVRWAAALP